MSAEKPQQNTEAARAKLLELLGLPLTATDEELEGRVAQEESQSDLLIAKTKDKMGSFMNQLKRDELAERKEETAKLLEQHLEQHMLFQAARLKNTSDILSV
jgi:hypothetical protein